MTRDAEGRRQHALVQRLLAGGPAPAGLQPQRLARGLAAYEANAAGSAERALAGAHPTVQALLGEATFAQVAQALWRAHPPVRGDLAQWGDALPAFLADDASLSEWPYFADCARLDAAVARAAASADGEADAATLARLGDTPPDRLLLDLSPAVAVVASRFPIVTLWQAHRPDAAADALSTARAALAEGRAECALVWRAGWRPCVTCLEAPAAAFTQAVQQGVPLGPALQGAGDAFAFEPWLVAAVRDGWLWRVRVAA